MSLFRADSKKGWRLSAIAAKAPVMKRAVTAFMAFMAFWTVSGAPAAGAEPETVGCEDASLVEPDMRVLESDLTPEGVEWATKTLEQWLPRLRSKNNWEAFMATGNAMTILEGYRLREIALASPEKSPEREAFCNFIKEAFYFD